MAKGKKVKKRNSRQHPNQLNLKIVTSSTCLACKQQCARGLAYLERMSQPGAIGNGVPCILTKPKA
ncbi:hypothetical protein BAG01nite_32560 [Brevibacillus agri]|uniref:Uncharacterized protein n=1 Tax=Brevibacillus agri TaxID=51101 RepID=A0A3M8B177_9BACL|nr:MULTISPECIES: hypothetical protein [Brevibacillus]ELK41816.1 hypothetical protein D478_11764 [Brevibacillus agri BAB-2500]EJL42667.1 hypothetical protein PMI08_03120 [Brevibacillus sp. CF112]MBG9565894.1 hypothetical protein [Brevibacillus agri]MBY0052482.1 hypothetical protein [Brevibacillus agri]MCG5254561.1 hypothetical protein [Brevibacillus agri]